MLKALGGDDDFSRNSVKTTKVTPIGEKFKKFTKEDRCGGRFEIISCKDGEILTPFFHIIRQVVEIDNGNLLVIGIDGPDSSLYKVGCDAKCTSQKVETPGDPERVFKVNEDTVLVATHAGEYFMDPRSCEFKSDIYDKIYYSDRYKLWIYEKWLQSDCDEHVTRLTGAIDPNGQVSEEGYDSFFNKQRVIKTEDSCGYPVIVDDEIQDDFRDHFIKEKARTEQKARGIAKRLKGSQNK